MWRGYHSLNACGTLNTPQWMKMPNLPSVNHAGALWGQMLSQSGMYLPFALTSSICLRYSAIVISMLLS